MNSEGATIRIFRNEAVTRRYVANPFHITDADRNADRDKTTRPNNINIGKDSRIDAYEGQGRRRVVVYRDRIALGDGQRESDINLVRVGELDPDCGW